MNNPISINNFSKNDVFRYKYNFSVSDNNFVKADYNQNKPTIDENKLRQKFVNAGLIIIAGTILLFSKGMPLKSKKTLENFKDYLGNKQGKYFADLNNPKLSFYEYSIRKINSFIKKLDGINNINSLKDILFMKLMYKNKFTKKIHQGISRFFEFLSKNTVSKSYEQTKKRFEKMYSIFDKLDEYILKNATDETFEFGKKQYSAKELVKKAKEHRETIKTVVDIFIAESAQKDRYNYIKTSTSALYSKFWNNTFKDFWTKNNHFKRKEMWQTFVAAEQVKNNKTALNAGAAFSRNLLSYTDAEKKSYIAEYITNLNSLISEKDNLSVNILKKLKCFIKDSSNISENKEVFLKELENLKKNTSQTQINKTIKPEELEDINTNIKLIRNILKEDAPGDIEVMLSIYRKIAPYELAKSGALKSLKKAIKSFDKSLKLEMSELFDKLRDLEIGSAPTDILSILLSSAMITYALKKAKNQDERRSVLLQSGIPIIGAIAVTFISATKLVSGNKSIIMGVVSGFLLNKIGKAIDNHLKGDLKKVKNG